jgi:hypothetical protein
MNSPLAHTVTTPEPTPRSPEVLDARTGWEPAVVSVRELMTSSEVAAVLRVSQATLCRWRQTGTGPRVLWLSARVPRYLWRDVEDWMERSRS